MEAKQILANALDKILAELGLPKPAKLVIEEPKDPTFGDLTTNAAMLLAKAAGAPPRELASRIADTLKESCPAIQSAGVAGPGFINIVFAPATWQEVISEIEKRGDNFGQSHVGNRKKVLVEYVSANPTGPLHVGHGRGAALGDTVARLLRASGYDVTTEYYLNDAGRQMRTLGLSIWLRLKELQGESIQFPEDCYQGDYIIDLAKGLQEQNPELPTLEEGEGVAICQKYGTDKILAHIRKDLGNFRCSHDICTSEQALRDAGEVSTTLAELERLGCSYENDGATWLKTMDKGDDRDRVLRKSDGSLTYFATDIAYHKNKLARGFDWLIDVWGADHHGYIPRMKAALAHMGRDPESLSVLLVQLVNLQRDGQAVSMSTRSGEFVPLEDVIAEVGTDAARFSFLSRSSDTPLDFDLELVKKRTLENPVYYVQYAHARICALMRRSQERGLPLPDTTNPEILARLTNPEELAILRQLSAFPDVVASAATFLAPHQVARYLEELSAKLHGYYAKYKILDDSDKETTLARLALLRGARITLQNGLNLLGVSAPEAM